MVRASANVGQSTSTSWAPWIHMVNRPSLAPGAVNPIGPTIRQLYEDPQTREMAELMMDLRKTAS